MSKLLEIINKAENRKDRITKKIAVALMLYNIIPLALVVYSIITKEIISLLLAYFTLTESFRIGDIMFRKQMSAIADDEDPKKKSIFYDVELTLDFYLSECKKIFSIIAITLLLVMIIAAMLIAILYSAKFLLL